MSRFLRSRSSTPRRGIRIAVMGSAAVGKTSIVKRFVRKTFTDVYVKTVEDMYRMNFRNTALEILDTAGAFSFPGMRDLAISTADAFVLVFAWDDNESFEYVRYLVEMIQSSRERVAPIIVVGNKSDLNTPPMVFHQTEMVVQIDWDHKFQKCSAKSNENIKKLFEAIVESVQDGKNKSKDGKKRGLFVDARERLRKLACIGSPNNDSSEI